LTQTVESSVDSTIGIDESGFSVESYGNGNFIL
jgi:hypothetical protein